MASQHRLRIGGLILSDGSNPNPNDTDFYFKVYGRDFTTGDAQPVNTTMGSLLQDGARVMTTRYENREAKFYVAIGGANSGIVAQGEAALAAQLGRRNELGWTPPDGESPESVLDVETSWMEQGSPESDDDFIEVRDGERCYLVTLNCQPFARAAELTTVPAVIVDPEAVLDEDTLDNASSLAKWSVPWGTLTHETEALGTVHLIRVSGTKTPQLEWTPTAPVSLSTQPFISLTTRSDDPVTPEMVVCAVNGVPAELVAVRDAYHVVAPVRTYLWRTSQTAINSLQFNRQFYSYGHSMFVYALSIRNISFFGDTPKQSIRAVDPGGSARTQGSLQVAGSDEGALGDVLLYSGPNGVGLPLRTDYRVSGQTPTADDAMVSGARETLVSTVFDVPVAEIPAGRYQVMARVNMGTSGVNYVLVATARARVGGVSVGPTAMCRGDIAWPSPGNAYRIVAVGSMTLPPAYLPDGSGAVVRVTLTANPTGNLDEAWLLNLDTGAVTVVRAGSHSRVWVETETIERPYPVVLVGDAADKSDAYADPDMVAARSGPHVFGPGLTQALIVTADNDAAEASFTFHRRYMTYVYDEDAEA